MDREELTGDLALMRNAVAMASKLALSFVRNPPRVQRKSDGSPVTDADLAVDDYLRSQLSASRPDYGWLSEESTDGGLRLGRSRVWVVDPIDGTRSFIQGGKDWTIGVALLNQGEPVLAIVANPVHGEVFEAAKGKGATLNGSAMSVSSCEAVSSARIIGGRGGQPFHPELPIAAPFAVRSALYRFALVACGRLDAVLATEPKFEWDVAPGALLVTEAGGKVTGRSGQPLSFNNPDQRVDGFVAANPVLHHKLLSRPQGAQV